jgi:hypothetical protein
LEGYPTVPDDMTNSLAVDTFLRGCRDKAAAFVAMDHEPRDVQTALKLVKAAQHNHRALGVRPGTIRHVSFDPDPVHTDAIQAVSTVTNRSPSPPALSTDPRPVPELEALRLGIRELLEEIRGARSRSPRGRSPSPRNACFQCGETGHFRSECKLPPMCFNCQEQGHYARECPKPRVGPGLGKRTGSPTPAQHLN